MGAVFTTCTEVEEGGFCGALPDSRKQEHITILIDVDNTIVDTETHFLTCFRKKFPHKRFIRKSDRRTYNFDSEDVYNMDDVHKILSSKGFWEGQPILEDAVQSIKAIDKQKGLNVVLIANPYTFGGDLVRIRSVIEKKNLIAKHFGGEWVHEKLVITSRKEKIFGHILIDDRPDPAMGRESQAVWANHHIVFSQAYNKNIDGKGDHKFTGRLNSWHDWAEIIGTSVGELLYESVSKRMNLFDALSSDYTVDITPDVLSNTSDDEQNNSDPYGLRSLYNLNDLLVGPLSRLISTPWLHQLTDHLEEEQLNGETFGEDNAEMSQFQSIASFATDIEGVDSDNPELEGVDSETLTAPATPFAIKSLKGIREGQREGASGIVPVVHE